MKLLLFLSSFLVDRAAAYKCGAISVPCIIYDSIYATVRDNFEDGTGMGLYLDSLNKSDILDYTTAFVVPVINDLTGPDPSSINVTKAVIDVFSTNFTTAFKLNIDVNTLRDEWAIPVAEWSIETYAGYTAAQYNISTLLGKAEATAYLAGGLETFLNDRSENDNIAAFVALPLLYIGYLENGLDLGIYFSQLGGGMNDNNGNSSNNALDVTEAVIDILSTLFINNDLFEEYMKADVAPIVEQIITGIDVTIIQFAKNAVEQLITRSLGDLLGLHFDLGELKEVVFIGALKEYRNATSLYRELISHNDMSVHVMSFVEFFADYTKHIGRVHQFMQVSIDNIYESFKTGVVEFEDVKVELSYFEELEPVINGFLKINRQMTVLSAIFATEYTKQQATEEQLEYLETIINSTMFTIVDGKINNPSYKFVMDDYLNSVNLEDMVDRIEMLLSDNLGTILDVNMELVRTNFASPIANIVVYLVSESDDNYGFLNDSEEEMINLLKNIRFLKDFMENIENIIEGVHTVTNNTATQYLSTGIKYVNNALLFRIGWMADRQDVIVPAEFKFANIVTTIVTETLGGNYNNTAIKTETVFILLKQEYNDVQNLMAEFSADYIEDAFETLEEIFEEAAGLLTSLHEELPEQYQSAQLLFWANLFDASSGATSVPMLITNVIGAVSNLAGVIDNAQELLSMINNNQPIYIK